MVAAASPHSRCVPTATPLPDALCHGPFTLATAEAHGVSRAVLAGRRFVRLFHGVYVVAALPRTLVTWLQAALLRMPADAVVSHLSALRLWGLEPGGSDDLHLSTNTAAKTTLRGVRLHRRRGWLTPYERHGLRVTGPDRTVVDCATVLGIVQLVQAAEHLIHLGVTTRTVMARYCDDRHLDGVQRARRAMAFVKEGVESPMESLVRLMLVFARLPCPEPNVVVRDEAGRSVARVDLLYARWKVVVEYDGWEHERSRDRRRRDTERREGLEALGYRVIVVIGTDLDRPTSIPWRVHAALVARGYDGSRPVTSVMWQWWFRPDVLHATPTRDLPADTLQAPARDVPQNAAA